MKTSEPTNEPIKVGIDIGGTFTDFVYYNPGSRRLETFKLLSTPDNPAEAVLEGIRIIQEDLSGPHATSFHIVHGSTVATNALLERKGARTAFVATAGFKDILQIGRQNRPELYNLFTVPPEALAPEELRFEAAERIGPQGEVIEALDPDSLPVLVDSLRRAEAESVAVCLLFSFLNPAHEQAVASALRAAGFPVSASAEILPEYREYERASTTAVNAYVSPVLENYLSRLDTAICSQSSNRISVMQSNGGQISVAEARQNGVRCILSGPAGGVIGAQATARLANRANPHAPEAPVKVLTFDMGGTSTDVSLIDGNPRLSIESVVAGCPIRIPVLDIHTIGAGGGSIASVDAGGALRVGPESAGADPGPACYGRADPETAAVTVTDANLVLGRLPGDLFLGGAMPLDTRLARKAATRLSRSLGMDLIEAAMGVIEVVNARMERALRVISVERGYDPREFVLLSFGGAGGLHAVDLARRLEIPRVIVPPLASTLSAFGMLEANVVKDYTQTVMLPGDTPPEQIEAALQPLIERGLEDIAAQGIEPVRIVIEPALDMRYSGQSFEITVPWRDGGKRSIEADFKAAHQSAYGFARSGAPIEIVNLRVRATGLVEPLAVTVLEPDGDGTKAVETGKRTVLFKRQGGPAALVAPLYRFEHLRPGNRIEGPALIARADTTVVLGEPDLAVVDPYQNLIIEVGRQVDGYAH